MVSTIEKLEDIKSADHIMEGSDHHWLVESIDVEKSSFSSFTLRDEKIIRQNVSWKPDKYHCIDYPPNSCNSEDVLQKAETMQARYKIRMGWK